MKDAPVRLKEFYIKFAHRGLAEFMHVAVNESGLTPEKVKAEAHDLAKDLLGKMKRTRRKIWVATEYIDLNDTVRKEARAAYDRENPGDAAKKPDFETWSHTYLQKLPFKKW